MEDERLLNMRTHMKQHLAAMAGGEDTSGIELSALIHMVANFYGSAISQKSAFSDLSGPRMYILMRLMVEEDRGNVNGINPTAISHYQNVKKNTISALLRGLEESGLVERRLDPVDKRVFLIRITKAGRDLIISTAPARMRFMNELASGLSSGEKSQLISLLEKLRLSLKTACNEIQTSAINTEIIAAETKFSN
jgi:DNA-binding MarR family transcriptional regulator